MSRRITVSNKTELTPLQAQAKSGGKLIFTDYQDKSGALLIQDNRLKAARFWTAEQSKIGAVYICKVKNVVSNIKAYFVEIGGENHEICFLSQKDATHPFLLNRPFDGRILEGDEFPVQVIKDAQKTKQASVTTFISLSNEYFAISAGDPKTGYSAKFTPAEKERLKNILQDPKWSLPIVKLPYKNAVGNELILSSGLVVRTQAACIDDSDSLYQSFQDLMTQWSNLFQTAVHRTCFSCLREAASPWQTALDELVTPHEYEEIITDDMQLFHKIQALEMQASNVCPAKKPIRLYDEKQAAQLPLSKLYGLSTKIEEALGRRIWLKSGGYLVIDKTEALTVIDVNSGKYDAKKDNQQAFLAINREAAEEIALQLRLRNLSGIILVDFINMKSSKSNQELMEYLGRLVAKDRQKTTVVDMTPLGLVELTRQKGYKSLAEQLN